MSLMILSSLSVVIPNLPALAGSSFYLRAFVPDLNANRWGIVASNGGHGVFGKR
jgi:hypothetical protein